MTAISAWTLDVERSRPNEANSRLALLLRCSQRTRAGVVLVSKNMNELTSKSRRVLTILTVLCAGLLVAALACNRGSAELATSTPPQPLQTSTATAQPIPPSAPPTATVDASTAAVSTPDPTTPAKPSDTPTLNPTPTQVENAERVMWSMLQPENRVNESAVVSAGAVGHLGLVPVLIEAAAATYDTMVALEIAHALERITGERVGGDFVLTAPWIEWMGQQDDIPELPGYAAWRGEIYSRIDPTFRDFFYEGVPHTVPLWSPMWGGVRRDGIPPLENPKVIPASEAIYLEPDEPVFGVVVNGEARAYPWRIMAWHELSNDIVGGRHISVVF